MTVWPLDVTSHDDPTIYGPLRGTLLRDGRVLGTGCTVGLAFGATAPLCNALYNPGSNTWSSIGSGILYLNSATLLRDGRVLAAGGTNFLSSSASAALFTLGALLPGRPTVTAASVASGVLAVRWSPGEGGVATTYRLQFFSGPTLLAAMDVGASNAFAIAIPPTIHGTYAVRVTAANAAGPSLALAPFTFSIATLAVPQPPVLTANELAVNPISLSWAPGGGAPRTHT